MPEKRMAASRANQAYAQQACNGSQRGDAARYQDEQRKEQQGGDTQAGLESGKQPAWPPLRATRTHQSASVAGCLRWSEHVCS